VFSVSRFHTARSATGNALLAVAFARRAFQLEQRRELRDLSELVPRYLSKIPADPFGTGALKYAKRGTKYFVYSIGPDGRDDGARPAVDAKAKPRSRYLVQADSTGDFVGGINR